MHASSFATVSLTRFAHACAVMPALRTSGRNGPDCEGPDCMATRAPMTMPKTGRNSIWHILAIKFAQTTSALPRCDHCTEVTRCRNAMFITHETAATGGGRPRSSEARRTTRGYAYEKSRPSAGDPRDRSPAYVDCRARGARRLCDCRNLVRRARV